MFEDVDELMDRNITLDEYERGLYFATAINGYCLEITCDNGEPLAVIYETASFPSDGYMPSVKRVRDMIFPQNFDELTLGSIYMDMVADGRTRYMPVRELEDWEVQAFKDAVMV